MKCSYEPELFPALRMTEFNPMCVNVFSSGKIVIMGLKTISYCDFVNDVINSLCYYI